MVKDRVALLEEEQKSATSSSSTVKPWTEDMETRFRLQGTAFDELRARVDALSKNIEILSFAFLGAPVSKAN